MGWHDEDPPYAVQKQLCEVVARSNGGIGCPRPEYVCKDGVLYALSKDSLNCVWAKFAQRAMHKGTMLINGTSEYMKLKNDRKIAQETLSFRHISANTYRAVFNYKAFSYAASSKYSNIYISATVTAEARCILHRKMFDVGPENLLYCDTDSLVFKCSKDTLDNYTSIGLGGWEDERKNCKITRFACIAPKTYVLETDEDINIVKAKGISKSSSDREKLTADSFRELLFSDLFYQSGVASIEISGTNTYANSTDTSMSYGELMTVKENRKMKVVLGKRALLDYTEYRQYPDKLLRVNTVPYGFEG